MCRTVYKEMLNESPGQVFKFVSVLITLVSKDFFYLEYYLKVESSGIYIRKYILFVLFCCCCCCFQTRPVTLLFHKFFSLPYRT